MLLEGEGERTIATGVEYRTATGEVAAIHAAKEVILSAGAIGSPQLLLLSGIGPRQELEAAGVACLVDAPDVGKHLQDHAMCPLVYPAPGLGVTMNEVALAMGPTRCVRRRAAARRSRRRREPLARTTGAEAGGGTAVRRVAGERTWSRRVVAG